jgi:hypothetical protein
MIARFAIALAAATLAACVHVEHTSYPAAHQAAHHPAPRIVMEEFRVRRATTHRSSSTCATSIPRG